MRIFANLDDEIILAGWEHCIQFVLIDDRLGTVGNVDATVCLNRVLGKFCFVDNNLGRIGTRFVRSEYVLDFVFNRCFDCCRFAVFGNSA